MRGVNKVIVIGNLGADPETRQFNDGGCVTNISVATSEQWTDKQTGEKKEATEWHRVSLFNRLGEISAQYLKKGSKVYIEGSLRTRKYQGQDGQDRYITEIRADSMQMLDSLSSNNQGGYGQDSGQNNNNTQYNRNSNQGGQNNNQNNGYNQGGQNNNQNNGYNQGGQNNDYNQDNNQNNGYNQGGHNNNQGFKQTNPPVNNPPANNAPNNGNPNLHPKVNNGPVDDDIPF